MGRRREAGGSRGRALRRGPALLLAGACACAAPAGPPPAPAPALPAPSASGRVAILLPAGDCPTGRLELQAFDRASGAWVPHPVHPRPRAGSCLEVRADRLLSELRVRCVDPQGARRPSAWVQGVRLDAPADPAACAPALESAPGTE